MFVARISLIVVILAGLACLAASGADPAQSPTRNPRAKPAPRAEIRSAARSHDEAEAVVKESARAFVEAYNRHDAKAIAAGFSSSAEFVTENGAMLHGRDSIEKHFAAIFADAPGSRVE